MKLLFRHNPARDTVAGTAASIAEITPRTLYDCHRIFYNPSNMVLCVVGDVDPERVFSIARETLPREPGQPPARDYGGEEPLTPSAKETRREMEVSRPRFYAGCAAQPVRDGKAYQKREVLGALACELLFGRSSPLYLRLYGEGLVGKDCGAEFEGMAGVAYTLFGGQSRDPDAVFEAVKGEIRRVLAAGLDADRFARVKKALYGRQMRALNDFDEICYRYALAFFRGYDEYRTPEILMDAAAGDVLGFIRENIVPERMAISVVTPKAGEGV
jgi:predicted Zn-dependent peptidase